MDVWQTGLLLGELLDGGHHLFRALITLLKQPPHNSTAAAKARLQILEGAAPERRRAWTLAFAMLEPDPTRRPNATALLEHPFLA